MTPESSTNTTVSVTIFSVAEKCSRYLCGVEQLNGFTMITTQQIGKQITEARKKKQLSQAQLAEHLFISPQAVGKWERGESLPDLIMLNRLAELLDVSLDYLSGNSAPGSPSDTPDNTAVTIQETPTNRKWDMSRGNWVDADFSGLKELRDKFSASNLQRCLFRGSDLSGLELTGNHVNSCDFSDSWIRKSHLKRSHLESNEFTHCDLQETRFTGSFVRNCDFTDADFSNAVFQTGGFEKNTLTNTRWQNTSFEQTYLADLVFNGPISSCYFENCSFKRVTFENAVLTNTFFKNKSLKQLRFIDCQADRITYEFLKNGKANLEGLSLLP